MNMDHVRSAFHSIGLKITSLILITVLPLVALLLYSNNQARHSLLAQTDSAHENMLQFYVNQMDTQLFSALSYISNLVFYEEDPQIIALHNDEATVNYAIMRTVNELEDSFPSYSFIDGYLIDILKQSDDESFFHASNYNNPSTPTQTLRDYLARDMSADFPLAAWKVVDIDDADYLFLYVQGDRIYGGAYARISNLIKHFEPSSVSGSYLNLISEKGQEGSLSATGERTIYVPSTAAPVLLGEHYSHAEILHSLPLMQRYAALVFLLILLLLFLLLYQIHHIITQPLLSLVEGMKHVQEGDWEYRVEERSSSTELEIASRTFNHMIDEVHALKINIYEQQLNTQKAQLRNLQMQIKPHFLINSLNMVYNLIGTDQIAAARELIQYSVSYFRFMMKIDQDVVPLKEELQHVQSYLDIQSVRYHGQFTYSLHVDREIGDILVPPVLLQGMVENSIKYALSLDKILHISICIRYMEKDYYPYADIEVSDNGDGFPEDYLPLLNSGAKIIRDDGAHIGLRNTMQRLHFLFGDKAECHFGNRDGPVSTILIPATFDESGENDDEGF